MPQVQGKELQVIMVVLQRSSVAEELWERAMLFTEARFLMGCRGRGEPPREGGPWSSLNVKLRIWSFLLRALGSHRKLSAGMNTGGLRKLT
jgi:hypothetical protein